MCVSYNRSVRLSSYAFVVGIVLASLFLFFFFVFYFMRGVYTRRRTRLRPFCFVLPARFSACMRAAIASGDGGVARALGTNRNRRRTCHRRRPSFFSFSVLCTRASYVPSHVGPSSSWCTYVICPLVSRVSWNAATGPHIYVTLHDVCCYYFIVSFRIPFHFFFLFFIVCLSPRDLMICIISLLGPLRSNAARPRQLAFGNSNVLSR